MEINTPLLNSQYENSLKKIEGKKWVYANRCYLGPLQNEKQNNLFALPDLVLNISREDFSSWLHDKVGTLNSKHCMSTSVLFNHFFILCGLLSGNILTVGLKVKATDVWCKNARRFSVFNCSDLTNKTVIFVHKAVPTCSLIICRPRTKRTDLQNHSERSFLVNAS